MVTSPFLATERSKPDTGPRGEPAILALDRHLLNSCVTPRSPNDL